ncbi:MAG: tRNA preQ1(34) S-adenosylmethionine ribosyltransferase-isomerase QueA [SAR324 cluster bacterium]|nr:tRNA preQ1(34) S-adenosylmethionine ribosyltransferase-isomerase QueA [SAR324 cluster bacterium]
MKYQELDNYDFKLPNSQIAIKPASKRDNAKLMIVNSASDVKHKRFYQLIDFLSEQDVLVFNDTKVYPARILAHRLSGGKLELLVLQQTAKNEFTAQVKSSAKIKENEIIKTIPQGSCIKVIKKQPIDGMITFSWPVELSFEQFINQNGITPVPPYILKQRMAGLNDGQDSQINQANQTNQDDQDRQSYHTIYGKKINSIAAPTAGLHFTKDTFSALRKKNIECLFLNLAIGRGTFAPLTNEHINANRLHTESYHISSQVAKRINLAIKNGKNILSVGTTSARALESAFHDNQIQAGQNDTNLFITPGFKFKVVSRLLTNFHLPRSSLSIMVHVFGGHELIKKSYRQAIKENYRFYSFGDAMLIDGKLAR